MLIPKFTVMVLGYTMLMHELSVTKSILEIALRHAEESEAVRVVDVYLVVGQLSSFVGESIQFYWDMLSKETVCAGAVLHFEHVAAEFYCVDCKRPFFLPDQLTPCPQCGGIQLKLIAGDEFQLQSIEIEDQ